MNIVSIGIVFGIMFVSGILISLLSSQLQCSKISFAESLKQGSVFASLPTAVYALASNVGAVLYPFKTTLESFGIAPEYADKVALGYLIMITSWVTTVWNVHSTEKAVCVATVQEMTEFKQKLLAELQQKQEAEEKNKEPA